VVEYAGDAIRALTMEQRMTVCNMSIEWGARAGFIAPDETTFAYLEGREFAPSGEDWERAVEDWRSLASDPDADFDTHVVVDLAELVPQVTWGTNPGMVVPVTGSVPYPASYDDPGDRATSGRASGSRTSGSTACSSGRARTRGSRTCEPPRRSSGDGRSTHG
jgi:3-isopropylmalate/(R)-2-methylmalate dehydratase large subunit